MAAGHFYPLLQVKVGDELLGRILSTFRMVSYSTIPLAYLMAGPLADYVFGPLTQPGGIAIHLLGTTLGSGPGRGMGLMLMVVGSLIMIWGLLAFLYRPLRELETDLPDALMGVVIHNDKDLLQQEVDKLLV